MYPNTSVNVPSAFRIQPSKEGTTSWPRANLVWGMYVAGSDGWALAAHAPNTKTAIFNIFLFAGYQLLSRLDALLIIRFIDVEQAHPREAHLVGCPLSTAHPILRIGIVAIVIAVVVPRRNVD